MPVKPEDANVKEENFKAKVGEVLKKAKTLTSFLFGPEDIIAVDVGTYSVKIVEIKQEGGIPVLKNWGYIPLNAKPEATPEEKKAQVINELRAFIIKKGVKIKDVATALSGNSVIVRYVKFPRLTKSELSATLATEAEPFIPFDINEVQLGFHILNEIVEEGQKKMETVLVAAKKDLIQQRLEVLQGAGLSPTIIDVDSFALENVYERQRDLKPEAGATLYLNIGHTVTNLSILEGGVTRVVRDIFISGNTLTKAIMKAFQVDFTKAEELKKTYGIIVDAAEKEKALQEGQREALGVSQTVANVVKDMVGEVHRSVDFYLSQGPERSIGRIVLMGGVARLKNLAKHLSVELKVPVTVLEPFGFLKEAPADLPADLAPAFGVAVGLALRRNKDWI
ncbi:MAG: type IV pilus assembly protein PilM [Elusimicrobia bacterium]|nr:type IV pilus assembly protein PilM [Elusimicrobiota bacterium]